MLSAHELATLLLVKNAPWQIDVDRAELDVLRAMQLIANEPLETGLSFPRVTPRGSAVLSAFARAR